MAGTTRPSTARTYIVLRDRGQITIPSEIREEYGWEDGERLELVKTPDGIRLESGRSKVMALAGSLASYAPLEHRSMDGQELVRRDRQEFEQAVANEVLMELEE